jgi:uncharacterized membrane protein
MDEADPIRRAAIERIKARGDFWRLLGVFVIIWLILTAIWALSGGGYFWPVWAIFGMSIGLAFAALGAFGPRKHIPTEEEIAEEVRRFGRSRES